MEVQDGMKDQSRSHGCFLDMLADAAKHKKLRFSIEFAHAHQTWQGHAVSRSWHFCIFQYVSWFVQKENAPWPIRSFGGESPSPSWDSKWNHREKFHGRRDTRFKPLKKKLILAWNDSEILGNKIPVHIQSLVMSEMPTSMPMTNQVWDFPEILGWSHQFRAFSGRSKARPSRRHAKLHHLPGGNNDTWNPEEVQINMNRFAFLLLRLFFGAFTSKNHPLPQKNLFGNGEISTEKLRKRYSNQNPMGM